MQSKRQRRSSNHRSATRAADAPLPKPSVSARLSQLRHYGTQLAALESLRNELRQFAVRLKVEAVSLSDMQRVTGEDGSAADRDDKDAATVGFSSGVSGISGDCSAGRQGSAAVDAAVSAGTRASSSSCSGACWDDARSFATTATAAAASIADTDDTDSNSGSAGAEEDEEVRDEYNAAAAYVSDLMDAEFSGSCQSDSTGDESSGSEIYSVHQL